MALFRDVALVPDVARATEQEDHEADDAQHDRLLQRPLSLCWHGTSVVRGTAACRIPQEKSSKTSL